MQGRRRALALGAAGLVALTTACAPGDPGSDSPADTFTAGAETREIDWDALAGETIDYLYFTDGPDEQATRDLLARFTEETGVEVNLQIVPYADLEQTLQARLSSGDAPAAARVADISTISDVTIDLRAYFGEDYGDQFLAGPSTWGTGPNGEVYGAPMNLTMTAPFVNVDQFAAAGVDLPTAEDPWTWDEMVSAATTVQERNGTEYALAIDKSGHRISALLSQFGTTLVDESGQVALDPAAAETVFGNLAAAMESGRMSRDFWLESGSKYAGANEIFLAGAAPVYLSGSWQIGQFEENAEFEWAVVPNISEARSGGMPGGQVDVAFSTSEHADAGAGLVEFLNRAESQTLKAQRAMWLPTRADLIESGVEYPTRGQDMQVFIDEIAQTPTDTYAVGGSPAFTPAATEMVDQIGSMIGAGTPATDAVAAVIESAEDAIAGASS